MSGPSVYCQCTVLHCTDHVTKCLLHVQPLLEQTRQICNTTSLLNWPALLTAYQDVFSRGDNDVEQTDMGEHFILLLDDTRPIRQLSRRLGLEKDREVERQVADLV